MGEVWRIRDDLVCTWGLALVYCGLILLWFARKLLEVNMIIREIWLCAANDAWLVLTNEYL